MLRQSFNKCKNNLNYVEIETQVGLKILESANDITYELNST